MGLKLTSFDSVLAELDAVTQKANVDAKPLASALAHCAQSIEYSLTAYPAMRSKLFRSTIGRIAKRKFLKQGMMSHDTAAPILGAPVPKDETVDSAVQRLRTAIDAFRAHSGPLASHLAYGECSRDEYEQLHSMHVADHLSALAPHD